MRSQGDAKPLRPAAASAVICIMGSSSAPEQVQVVEEAYRAWNADGPSAFVAFTTTDVELHDAPELPDAQAWIGHDALVARLEEVVASTGGKWADVDDVRAVGDAVVVSLTWRFDRRAATLASVYHVVWLDGGKIARIRVFLDEATALSAAGVD